MPSQFAPIQGFIYNDNESVSFEDFIYSPNIDSLSKARANSLNSVHLCYPASVDQVKHHQDLLLKNNIIRDILSPSVFILLEKYTGIHGKSTTVRKSILANLRLDQNQDHLLPHEHTFDHYEFEKEQVLTLSGWNTIPSLAYYADDEYDLVDQFLPYAELSIAHNDDQRTFQLFQLSQTPHIEAICTYLNNQQFLLADGHHRLQGSLRYSKKLNSPVNHLIQTVNRVHAPPHLDSFTLMVPSSSLRMDELKKKFNIKETRALPSVRNEKIIDLITSKGLFELTPKNKDTSVSLPSFLQTHYHECLIGKVFELGEHELNNPSTCFHLGNRKDIDAIVAHGKHIGIRPPIVPFDSILEVASQRKMLPEKSTRFLPKLSCGILMGKVDIQPQMA